MFDHSSETKIKTLTARLYYIQEIKHNSQDKLKRISIGGGEGGGGGVMFKANICCLDDVIMSFYGSKVNSQLVN